MALVHWWYTPDSWNGYIPADTAPEIAEPDKRIKGPWKVYARWLQDSAKYNEWMNPIDYETEEAQAEQEAAAAESPHGVPVAAHSLCRCHAVQQPKLLHSVSKQLHPAQDGSK